MIMAILMVFACASTKSFEPDPKYNLGNQLEEVSEIQ
jgi:hypothetical protein